MRRVVQDSETRPARPDSIANFAVSTPREIHTTASRLRERVASAPERTLEAAGRTFSDVGALICTQLRQPEGEWHPAFCQMADAMGYSRALLRISLEALLRPLSEARELARRGPPRRELIGFIMPGNVPGAGLHELVVALSAGCAAIVKTSLAEPIFFRRFAESLHEVDALHGGDFAGRLAVFDWGRERADLTTALLDSCDRIVAMGADSTIALLDRNRDERFLGFGSRVSGAAVMRESVADDSSLNAIARALALDCVLFDQRGCLSPHHIFVEGRADEFARQIAIALDELWARLAGEGSPMRIGLEDAAATRRAREAARWRMIGGAAVKTWEGHGFAWTVVLDRAARFTPSPGFCTLYISEFDGLDDLSGRLEPARGKLEGFALAGGNSRIAGARRLVEQMGATYVCAPGAMQSPPLDWPHGGGAFVRMMLGREIG